MKAVLETITPKKAAELLKLNTRNRPCSMSWADRLAEAIRRGEWKVNGDTIKLNGDVLVDGQHRLHAIVKAGVPIQTYIVRGVQSEAFDTIDQGRKRTTGDMFARSGEKYYINLATACRFIFAYENGYARNEGKSFGFTPTQARVVLEKNPGLRDSMEFIVPHAKNLLISAGLAAALHYLFARKSHDLAERFFLQLATGENINRNFPVYALRERLRRNASDQGKIRGYTLAAFVIKAWNATRAGEKLQALRMLETEDYPKVK